MIDYQQLKAVACVIDLQSFDKAAQHLHLTQSAVSQRVKQLEETLGQLLIVRGQPLQPTPGGVKLLRYYRQIELLQVELMRSLNHQCHTDFIKLAIGVNADSLATWFLDAVSPLLDDMPVLLELRVDDQEQTHRFLRQGEVIGCVSSDNRPIQGAKCIALGNMHYRALATERFIRRYFANGVNAESLKRAPVVEFNEKDELQAQFLKTFFNIRRSYPRHFVPSSQVYVDLITRGYGWGMVPEQQSVELIKRRQLKDLCPGKCMQVPLYWHTWNMATELSDRLTALLLEHCRKYLQQQAAL